MKAKPIRLLCCNHFTHGGFLTTDCKHHNKENEYIRYAVNGTLYGMLHNTSGGIRLFKSYSGAYKAAQKYNAYMDNYYA